METYINLYGPNDSGKTNTLNILIDKLRQISKSKQYKNYPTRVFFKIFKNIVVCIATSGDDIKHIHLNHEFFEDCDGYIVVTASRPELLQYIYSYIRHKVDYNFDENKDKITPNYLEIQMPKTKEEDDATLNAKCHKYADYLFEQIMLAIKL